MTTVLLVFCGLYFLYTIIILIGLNRLRPAPIVDETPPVSVVVAARNEAENLPRLLDGLIAQDYPIDAFEIIVVDDRSTDKTEAILSEYAKRYPALRSIRITENTTDVAGFKNHAISEGIARAKGDVILATDADCQVQPGWARSMVSTLQSGDNPPGIVVGFSRMETPHDSNLEAYQQLDFLALMTANAGVTSFGWAWSGSGQNLAYRKDTFDEIGGFSGAADRPSGDDFYLVQTISKQYPIRFNSSPDSFVATLPKTTFKQFLTQHFRWASNTRYLLNARPLFLTFLISAFITNLSVLLGLLFWNFPMWLTIIVLKLLFETMVIHRGSKQFETPVSFNTFMGWFILQPIYIPVTGINGLIGKVRWK